MAYLVLIVVLVVVYVAWVMFTGWVVLQVIAPEGVSTLVWIATVVSAAVFGGLGSLVWDRRGGSDKYIPLWWIVAPAVLEVAVFGGVSLAKVG